MILSMPNPRSSSPSLASGMSYQANDPTSSTRRKTADDLQKGARGDQRQHTCPCPAFDCHVNGFPRRDPSQMQLPALPLPWFPSSPLRRLRPAGLPTTLRGAAEGSTPPQLPPTRLGATVCGPCSASVPIPSRSPRACDELAGQGVRAGGGVLCRARFAPAGAEPDGYAVLAATELSRKQWL